MLKMTKMLMTIQTQNLEFCFLKKIKITQKRGDSNPKIKQNQMNPNKTNDLPQKDELFELC